MRGLINIREKMKSLYAEYDVYFRPVLKFALALMLFTILNNWMGYLEVLNSLFVIVILAVICAILPLNGMVVIGILLIVAHSFGLGLEVGAFSAIIYLLMVLLYFRFVPGDALAILLAPIAYTFRVPALLPITLGLTRGPISAASAAFGILSWRYVQILHDTIEPLKHSQASLLDILQRMPKELLSKELVSEIIIAVVVVLAISVVRKLLRTYNWEISIILGAVIYLGLSVASSKILGTKLDMQQLILGTLITIAVCFVLAFFFFNAKYKESQYLQFEDERFFYFVKAVPKTLAEEEDDLVESAGQSEAPEDFPGGMRELMADEENEEPVVEPENITELDIGAKLEDSLEDI